jgi:hypothetical protein
MLPFRPDMTHSGRLLAAAAAAAVLMIGLAPVRALAGEAPPAAPVSAAPAAPAADAATAPEAAERDWAFSVSGNAYLFPGDDDLVMGVATADRKSLHLETRYNYEDRNTWSFWGGWTWSTGTKVEFEITPMLGAVTGDTDGVAPGLEMSLAWKRLDYYLESEHVFDAHNHEDNFYYAWSELALKPVDWLRVGLVAQRTRVFESDLDIQRGLLAQATVGHWTFGVDWFNPLGDDTFTVVVATVEF